MLASNSNGGKESNSKNKDRAPKTISLTKNKVGPIRNIFRSRRPLQRFSSDHSDEQTVNDVINPDTFQMPEMVRLIDENPPAASADPPGTLSQIRLSLKGRDSLRSIDPPARHCSSQNTVDESESVPQLTVRDDSIEASHECHLFESSTGTSSIPDGPEHRSDPNGVFPEPDETMDAGDSIKKHKEPSKPGAYHVTKSRSGGPVTYHVSIPEGVLPFEQFAAIAGSRRILVRCPENGEPGLLVEITLPPESYFVFKLLKKASLTCSYHVKIPSGGARAMESDIKKVNDRALLGDGMASSHVVTIPNNVRPGESFSVTVDGHRFEVKCPPNMKQGKRIRVILPPSRNELDNSSSSFNNLKSDAPTTQVFQVKIPNGIEPGKPFAVSVKLAGQQGQQVLVRCPTKAVAGQFIEFHLPTAQVVGNIQLKYETFHRAGWKRTIRADDLRFQWVRLNGGEVNLDCEVDLKGMEKFDFQKSAFFRKVTFLEGNDTRLRTGLVELVSADDAFVDSKIVKNNRTLFSFADVAVQQSKPLHEKHDWFCQTICKRLMTPIHDDDEHIRIYVQRSNLLEDSVRAVMSLSADDMKRQWKVHFLGEPVLDAGGPTREWFELVTDLIFDPSFGLWLPSVNNRCLDINVASETNKPNEYLVYYRFTGRVIGRALFDRQLVPKAHMARIIYKHILGWPITFEDIKDQDEAVFESLLKMTKMENVSDMSIDFTITEERNGRKMVEELVKQGSAQDVNNENLADFLKAFLRYRTFTRTLPQLAELLLGFFDVVPEPALTIFDANELELILCGFPEINLTDWKDNTEYKGVFEFVGIEHEVVKWFWELIEEYFDVEMRARLLQFATGTSGVPASGFAGLQGNDAGIRKFTIHGVDSAQFVYPKSHTCFNRIDVPTYSTKDELAEKLTVAITTSFVGFDIE